MYSLVTAFTHAMAIKLDKNAHKDQWEASWLDMSKEEIYERLDEEIKELKESIDNLKPPAEVLDEACDVANFIIFLVNNYKEDWEEKMCS